MKSNKFLLIISVLTLVVFMIGSTFAYFAVSASSDNNAVSAEAAVFDIKLDVSPLYTGKPLIPMNDSDVDTALENLCVDMFNNGACDAYTITVRNDGQETDYVGTINFDIEGISNLKYRLLDSDDNVYYPNTLITGGTDLGLGEGFTLDTGEEKVFKLIVWLSNINGDQTDDDADGHYNATVTYTSSAGSKVTGTFTV